MSPAQPLMREDSGAEAWITFHGSWDRDSPVGYKMGLVRFDANGEPVDSLESKTALQDIFANQDNSRCPGNCFRPVGMAIDSRGRIFVSSDASGEIYLVSRTTSASSTSGSPSGTPSSTTGSGPASTGIADRIQMPVLAAMAGMIFVLLFTELMV
jgi:hypothetical protein